jgi:polyhydroxybutyrate depolymerase
MVYASMLIGALLVTGDLGPGNHTRHILSNCHVRTYLVHVPPSYNPCCRTPVVLDFHGLGATARMMKAFAGLDDKADQCGFIVVYPNGGLRSFNAGAVDCRREFGRDEVKFVDRILDDLQKRVNVDPCRIYATGLSDGGMMCYRLACGLSHRIAAIASVSGPQTIVPCCPCRPVPILHFHGTCDPELPMAGPKRGDRSLLHYYPVLNTMNYWACVNGCPSEPIVEPMPDLCCDGTTVTRTTWGPGCCGAEVVLYTIHGGGHTWPGRKPPAKFLGNATYDINADDVIWDFFCRHPMCCCQGQPATDETTAEASADPTAGQ